MTVLDGCALLQVKWKVPTDTRTHPDHPCKRERPVGQLGAMTTLSNITVGARKGQSEAHTPTLFVEARVHTHTHTHMLLDGGLLLGDPATHQ